MIAHLANGADIKRLRTFAVASKLQILYHTITQGCHGIPPLVRVNAFDMEVYHTLAQSENIAISTRFYGKDMVEEKNCAKRLVQHQFKPYNQAYLERKSLIVDPSPWSDPSS